MTTNLNESRKLQKVSNFHGKYFARVRPLLSDNFILSTCKQFFTPRSFLKISLQDKIDFQSIMEVFPNTV